MTTTNNRRSGLYYLIVILLVGNILVLVGFYQTLMHQQYQLSLLRERNSELERTLEVVTDRFDAPHKIYGRIEQSVVEVMVMDSRGIPYNIGSGFVFDGDGHVITNAHVVGGSDSMEVTFSDGTIVKATLVGMDAYSDLAVIKVDAPQDILKPVVLGNSSQIEIGEAVLVVGNPYGLSGSMSGGIVSQLDRVLPTEGGYLIVGVIQVDAAINPGNSGGPLLNYFGEVMGVNTALRSGTGEFTGVGFVIPSNLVGRVVPLLIMEGVYLHPWLGMSGSDVTPEIARFMKLNGTSGVLLNSVIADGPADKAGLKAGQENVSFNGIQMQVGGDVIIGINGHPIEDMRDLLIYLEYNTYPGEVVTFDIIRNGEAFNLAVKLGERPQPE